MPEVNRPFKRVVARLKDGRVLKGFVDPWANFDARAAADWEDQPGSLPHEFELRHDVSTPGIKVQRESLKALFFVKSFEGNKEYNEVKFFEKNPTIKGLWVRVQFYDHESLEGIVANTVKFVVQPTFFLKPPDPQSNNEILCVVKSSLVDFRVLGVKMDY